jgi:hypothetical protein
MSDYWSYGLFFAAVAACSGMAGFVVGRWWGSREERERCVFWSSWPESSKPPEGRAVIYIQPPSQGVN